MKKQFWSGTPAFKTRGFYLHSCWVYDYPFAVRSWSREDYDDMFHLLKCLEIDQVMIWPMVEIAPDPLSPEDRTWIEKSRQVVDTAQSTGLECWVTTSPNLLVTEDIRKIPIAQRHFYPYRKVYRFDDATQNIAYTKYITEIFSILNNADGYVFIDGDPGGYPNAKPEDFIQLFHTLRNIIDQVGTHPSDQIVLPWIWCGWGTDWDKEGPWKPDLEKYVPPVLRAFKENPPREPWGLLPGRSGAETWANGRKNFVFTENEGLIDRSTLMLYEIIEYEPCPPAVLIQFDRIRRVMKQELKYANRVRGVFGNAQTPLLSLQNLFLFARAAWNPEVLSQSNEQILSDFADFLGGPADLLIPAWSCTSLGLDHLESDLPSKLRGSILRSSAAQYLPGTPHRYLEILAQFVETRISILQNCSEKPHNDLDAARNIARSIKAMKKWWQMHHYILSGESSKSLDWNYTSPYLLKPLVDYAKSNNLLKEQILNDVSKIIVDEEVLPEEEISPLMDRFIKGEYYLTFPD